MPKLKFEKPLIFDQLLVEMQDLEGGFTVHTPDSVFPSFIGDLLDLHFPERDKTECLGLEVDVHDLLAGEYVTPVDEVVVLEHFDARRPGDPVKAPAESTSFISIKSVFIGLPEAEDRIVTIIPVPEAEDTPS